MQAPGPAPPTSDRRLPVVVAASAAMLPAAAVVLRSVGETLAHGWTVEAHVFSPRVPLRAKVLASLRDLPVEVEWHQPSPLLGRLPEVTGQPLDRMTYQRLFAPEALAGRCSTFVYLDADVVVRRSLHHLLEEARAIEPGWALAAAVDHAVPFAGSPLGLAGRSELGIHPLTPYFNAGVMAVDVDRWLGLDLTERALAYVDRFAAEMHMDDQEALNAVTVGRWARLSSRWNAQVGCWPPAEVPARPLLAGEDLADLEADPWIVHYTARTKPWSPGLPPPLAEQWWHVLARTAFADRPRPRPRTTLRARLREARDHARHVAWLVTRAP